MSMARGANQDPGERPSNADELLADLMHTGEILDRHHEQGAALDATRESIAARRGELEAEREEAERQLVDDFNAKNGQLGMEAEGLRDEERKLKNRQGRYRRKVGRLEDQLRELAGAPDADRSTVVAYAALLATKPDFTAAAVAKMGDLDEAVRTASGQPFALVQGRNFAFGRIEEEADGLVVDTGEGVRWGAIRLPMIKTNPVNHARRKPYFGFFSEGFDHPRDGLYDTYDSILGRRAEEDEVTDPDGGWSAMSHFNLGEGNLVLYSPEKVEAADADTVPKPGDPEEEGDGYWGRQDALFTGPAAEAFMHRVVDARLNYVRAESTSLDSSVAHAELSRFLSVAARLDLAIDLRKIPIHQDLLRM